MHLEKLTKDKDAIIKVASRTDAIVKPDRETTRPLTGRWMDTIYDEGARKTRWTTWGYEQTPNESEDFSSAVPEPISLKMTLAASTLKEHVAAIGDCNGTFYQSPLNPDGTERKVWIELLEKAESGEKYIWKAVSESPGFK